MCGLCESFAFSSVGVFFSPNIENWESRRESIDLAFRLFTQNKFSFIIQHLETPRYNPYRHTFTYREPNNLFVCNLLVRNLKTQNVCRRWLWYCKLRHNDNWFNLWSTVCVINLLIKSPLENLFVDNFAPNTRIENNNYGMQQPNYLSCTHEVVYGGNIAANQLWLYIWFE